jgi:hypothetical protein
MSVIKPLRSTLGRIVHRGTLPYTSLPLRPGEASFSDQFLYRGDLAGHRFVAENTLALLCGEAVPMTHRLSFFDAEGTFLGHQDTASDRLFTAIDVGDPGADLASYIHTSRYGPDILRAFATDHPAAANLRRLHRGYALYRRSARSVYAAVHGNVGGIRLAGWGAAGRTRHLARRRGWFLYTPQIRFAADQTVSLYLLNPCPQREPITVLQATPSGQNLSGSELPVLSRLEVPGRGVRCCRLEGISGSVTLRSRLPMCRPLIFIETDGQPDHFDVFHT